MLCETFFGHSAVYIEQHTSKAEAPTFRLGLRVRLRRKGQTKTTHPARRLLNEPLADDYQPPPAARERLQPTAPELKLQAFEPPLDIPHNKIRMWEKSFHANRSQICMSP